ncbi:HPr kinase [Parvibaculum lavamentivorans DS-1]|uniref:HPr kinase n=1 Tax=Parvibaculum lavamentivorans (strain DS-1 / DSM 13023 / NCIMB 13966) TaxID=402881 RepID=A7HPA3_PARL1|nr:aldolase [Parvibaculum lavamentivorans]ABS61736.1 HPr kinase [Parvibaculum lavamentivorans DS-1]
MAAPLTIHGTCVACGARAVLLRGPSGAGKSDLAFRLIRDDASGETRLVADDQVALRLDGSQLVARAPAALAGALELRGLGLLAMPSRAEAVLSLIVDLVPRAEVPRLPEARYEEMLGVRLPLIALHAFDISAAAKLRLALETLPDGGFPSDDGRFGPR